MAIKEVLLARIAQHCASAGMTERDFGWASVDDGRLVERLRAGKATLRLIERAEAFLDGRSEDARLARSRAPSERVSAA